MALQVRVEIPMILLTGASGFIGTEILKKLEHEKVICLSRSRKSSCYKNINARLQDISTDLVPDTVSTIIHLILLVTIRLSPMVMQIICWLRKIYGFPII